MNEVGVYVHIPFCRGKCLYCDFPSYAGREEFYGAYKDAVINEIDNTEELRGSVIDSIFFGGGTPTVLPARFLAEILGRVLTYSTSSNAEISLEANPGAVNEDALRVLRNAGFNRLSLGIQAWRDHLLKRLGRIHSAEDIPRAYEAAVNAGFDNINLDLMFSLPGQTLDDWTESLRKTAALKPAHISAYSLIIEEGTEFYRLYNQEALKPPDEEEDRRMYYAACDILASYGYHQYEISNFALEGRECRHNIKYWKRLPYLGVGTDSHSFYNNMRWHNTHSLEKYLRTAHGHDISGLREDIAQISVSEAMEETMFLGLRLNEGVDEDSFRRASGSGLFEIYGGVIEKMISLGLMAYADNRVFLTAKGRDVSNYVFTDFMLG